MNQYRLPLYASHVVTMDGRRVPQDEFGWLLPIDAAQETMLRNLGAVGSMQSVQSFANGLTIAAGGLTVTAGGIAVTAGGLTVSAGATTLTGALAANGATTFGSTVSHTAAAAVTFSPSNAAVTLSPTGTGNVVIAPATAGTINNMSIGVTTPAVVKTSNLQAGTYTDISGTPGNGTSNGMRGRAAFAAAASTVVVTNSLVTATSSVFVQLGGSDPTLTTVRVTPGAGSFTVTGNAAATGITPFDFHVIN